MIESKYPPFSLVIIFILFWFHLAGQPGGLTDIGGKFKQYNEQHLQEKLYLHTDKSFYVCGEIIWFKLYNVDAYLNNPLSISKIAYVELLTEGQKPVLQAKIELTEGTGNGSLMLPFSLNSGVYVLRAYTNWMKNFSAELFFETPLTIVNTLKKLPPTAPDSLSDDIQFFPEGGNMVYGLQSVIGFRAVGTNGKGSACKGIIVNQQNDTITSFESLRFGMGHFTLKPVSGNTYKAIVQTGSGQTIMRGLPAAYDKGYVMKLIPGDTENISVFIQSNLPDEPVFLLVHTQHEIKLAQTKKLKDGMAEFTIKKTDLGEGVSHFTLFNNQQQPICERLYFRKPGKKLNIEITANKDKFSRRQNVSIKLTTQGNSLQPTKADLSISVFSIDSLQAVPDSDIQSYLWLSADLKGIVDSPLYYFTSADSTIEEATNNLMLTQGWSRFKWEDALKNNKPSFRFLPEYEGPIIAGNITQKSSGLPVKDATVFLTVRGENFLFKSCTSNENGNIIFNTGKFYGNKEVILQPGDRMSERCNIDISNPFISNFSLKKYPALQLFEKWQGQLLSYSVSSQIENSYVQDNRQQFHVPLLTDTTFFYGNPDATYFLDDYTRFITMEEVMREYVPEVKVRKLDDQFVFRVKNTPLKTFFENNPLVLLDGLPVFDITKLMAIDPLKIKRLDLVTQKFYTGKNVNEGIVSYSTYNNDLASFQIDPDALVLDFQGLQLQREFYSPLYDTKEKAESRLPDFRNVLYWSPAIKTDEKGESQISFYISDRPGKYVVFVQGMTSNGAAGSKVEFFTVTK